MDKHSLFDFAFDDPLFDFTRQLGGDALLTAPAPTPPSAGVASASSDQAVQLSASIPAAQYSAQDFHQLLLQQQAQQMMSVNLQLLQQQPSYRAEEAVSSLLRAGEATRKRLKFTRSRLGCLTCKARKLKCDEQTPVCGRCITAKRECRWTDDHQQKGSQDEGGAASSSRKRPLVNEDEGSAASSSRVMLDDPQLDPPPQPGTALGRQLFRQASASRRPLVVKSDAARGDAPLFVDLVPPDAKLAIMTSPAYLDPFFPSVEEKMLIHHYFHHTTRIIVARDSHINFWVTKHGPLAFSVAKGYSPACDALRSSLLLVGAVHLRYLSSSQSDSDAVQRLRQRTVSLIKRVIEREGTEDDELLLCALLSCTVSCSLGGDEGWQELLALASRLIDRNGGPKALLATASRHGMSSLRFVVEQIATRQVFGCLTTGAAPNLLGEGFAPWFFEMEMWSASEEERASIEIMFGLSRGMVDLIARVAALVARKHKTGFVVLEDEDADSASPTNEANLAGLPPADEAERVRLETDARTTMLEIEIWSTRDTFTPVHPRVQFGNSAHRIAMSIHILTNVFVVERSDPRVTGGAKAIISVIKAAAAEFKPLTWLTWPVLIAGMSCAPESRDDVRSLVAGFGDHAAFDNLWALTVLTEFWRREDEGQRPSLREVVDALGLEPFFD